MSFFAIFIAIVVGFYIIITLIVIGLWQSYKTENLLGALVLMWMILALFLLAMFLARRNISMEKTGSSISEKIISFSVASFSNILEE